ncbi:MAG: hypothetical protein RLZ33_704 [Bacteroidota bacterium]|jgi:nitric oxide reductase subunit C
MKSIKISVPAIFFIALCLLFLVFSFSIYLKPYSISTFQKNEFELAGKGRLVWQKYNCQACHQLYGLGGYLGPDLTNEFRKLNKNEDALRAFFKGGMKQMPQFNLSKEEEIQLIEFLKSTDATGNADPRKYKILSNGMTEQYEK